MTSDETKAAIIKGVEDLLMIIKNLQATGPSYIRIDSIEGEAKQFSIGIEKRCCISRNKNVA